jgi:hypothetical protein
MTPAELKYAQSKGLKVLGGTAPVDFSGTDAAQRSKYGNTKTRRDGFTFDSIAEADYYEIKKLEVAQGRMLYFLRQVPFHLPGGVKYICDFAEFYKNGVTFVDVKGMQTRDFINKRKMVRAMYGVNIYIVKRGKGGSFEIQED